MSKTMVPMLVVAALVATNVSSYILYGMHLHPWWAMPVRWVAFAVLAIFAIVGTVKMAADRREPSP